MVGSFDKIEVDRPDLIFFLQRAFVSKENNLMFDLITLSKSEDTNIWILNQV